MTVVTEKDWFADAARHAENPPATWKVTNLGMGQWALGPQHGGVIATFPTKSEAERNKTAGPHVERYEQGGIAYEREAHPFADLDVCPMSSASTGSSESTRCRGIIHHVASKAQADMNRNDVEPTVIQTCSVHRLTIHQQLHADGRMAWDVEIGDYCAFSATISGTDQHGACEGYLTLHMFSPPPGRYPRSQPSRIYVCARHAPKGALKLTLPDEHPVMIWDRMEQLLREPDYGTVNFHRMLMYAAKWVTHSIPANDPAVMVYRAEGRDARLTYRWALPYLRAYGQLMVFQNGKTDYEQAAIALRPEKPVGSALLTTGPASAGWQGKTCEIGGEPIDETTGWWYVRAEGRGWKHNQAVVCAHHAMQMAWPAPDAHPAATDRKIRMSIGARISQTCRTLGIPCESPTVDGYLGYVVNGQRMTTSEAADYLFEGGFDVAWGADTVQIREEVLVEQLFERLAGPAPANEHTPAPGDLVAVSGWSAGTGTVRGVDEDGRVVVDHGGELSHVPADRVAVTAQAADVASSDPFQLSLEGLFEWVAA